MHAAGNAFAHSECASASNPILGLSGFFSSSEEAKTGAGGEQLYWTLWLFSWVFAAVGAAKT